VQITFSCLSYLGFSFFYAQLCANSLTRPVQSVRWSCSQFRAFASCWMTKISLVFLASQKSVYSCWRFLPRFRRYRAVQRFQLPANRVDFPQKRRWRFRLCSGKELKWRSQHWRTLWKWKKEKYTDFINTAARPLISEFPHIFKKHFPYFFQHLFNAKWKNFTTITYLHFPKIWFMEHNAKTICKTVISGKEWKVIKGMAKFGISMLFQYFMHILDKFNSFSRSWKPTSQLNTFKYFQCRAWEPGNINPEMFLSTWIILVPIRRRQHSRDFHRGPP